MDKSARRILERIRNEIADRLPHPGLVSADEFRQLGMYFNNVGEALPLGVGREGVSRMMYAWSQGKDILLLES